MAISSAFGPVVVDRVVHGTITTMCVLIVYDGWSRLKLLDVLGVIVGPIVAMFLSHVFSSALAQQVDLGRRLTVLAIQVLLQPGKAVTGGVA